MYSWVSGCFTYTGYILLYFNVSSSKLNQIFKKNAILTFGRQNLTLSHPNRSLFVCISPCITFLGVVPKWNGKKGSQRRFQCGFVLLLHSLALAQLFETLQSEQGTSYYLAGFLPSDTHSWSRKRLSELKLFCVLYECVR